jgi:hypothetical protein
MFGLRQIVFSISAALQGVETWNIVKDSYVCRQCVFYFIQLHIISTKMYKYYCETVCFGGSLCHVGFEVLTAVIRKSSIFWYIVPCSLLKISWRFGGTYRLESSACHLLSTLIYYSAYSLTPKMKAICSSEKSVNFKWTSRRYIRTILPSTFWSFKRVFPFRCLNRVSVCISYDHSDRAV